jgi:hypothetical protein
MLVFIVTTILVTADIQVISTRDVCFKVPCYYFGKLTATGWCRQSRKANADLSRLLIPEFKRNTVITTLLFLCYNS